MIEVVVLGGINFDVTLFVDAFPLRGDQTVVRRMESSPGGKGGNAAVAAARLLGPDRVALIAALGRDELGERQRKILESDGVSTLGLVYIEGVESGRAYVAVDAAGENVIFSYPGANGFLAARDLRDPSRRSLIEKAKVVAILNPPLETAEEAAALARQSDCLVVFDPGIRAQAGSEGVRGVLDRIDYLVANEPEIEHLTGTRDPERAGAALLSERPELKVIVKLGDRGCVLFQRSGKLARPGIQLRSIGREAVNTAGCGDAFLGAFVAAKVEGLSDEKALEWANWAGALKATRAEARGSPTRRELLRSGA